jgi:hypothetical protein
MKKNNPTIYLKALVFIVLLIAQTYTFSQTVYVPYRVGNKFGIADENGKMIIKPQFDILEPHWKLNHCFYGFTKTDSNVLSSVIYNNKIIISKQKYDYYYVYHSLILAYEYLIVNKKVLMDGDNVKQRNHLYNSDGVKVLNGNFKTINIYSELDRDGLMNEVIFFTEDVNNKYAVHVYDRKLKKITRTYFNKSNYLEVDHHQSYDYRDTSVTFIYRDVAGKGRKIKLTKKGKAFVKVLDKAVVISDTESEYDERVDMAEVAGDYAERERPKPSISEDSIVLKARKVIIKSSPTYKPKEVEEIYFTQETFNINDKYIAVVNRKVGLKDSRADTFIVKPKYSEIMAGEIHPQHGGYIMRTGDRYGLYIYNYPNNIIIEPIFDKIALMENVDYFKKDAPLLKLYDQNGKLFCYANQYGKLFYKEN